MVDVTLRKQGHDWIIVLPDDEIDRLGLNDGQQLNIQISHSGSEMTEHQRRINEIMDRVVVEYREAFEYLAK